MKIYTKTGDKGTTSLLGGDRVEKHHPLIDLYGEVDELNCFISQLIAIVDENKNFTFDTSFLRKIQTENFIISSLVSCPKSKWEAFKLKQHDISMTTSLEESIDEMEASLTELKNFIAPGVSLEASLTHILRTKTRKIERKMTVVFIDDEDFKLVLKFYNRLSDYFFTLARTFDHLLKKKEIIINLS
ncbi:cob(I)yrinic acid a,c-diamide adenosyltransferase [Bacteriovoracaceae bacterium]|nr:cob(I)yrinic acid a,c-diamide adenosyltransferase [Bacteriovoracaceae bacterium]